MPETWEGAMKTEETGVQRSLSKAHGDRQDEIRVYRSLHSQGHGLFQAALDVPFNGTLP
jgi:hypothetical protein